MFCGCGASNKNITDNNVQAKQTLKISKVDPIVVCKSFDLSKAEIKYNEDTSIFAAQLSEKIVIRLKKAGYNAVLGSEKSVKGIYVEGHILKIDAGSTAARMWVGFGAGASKMDAEIIIKNSKGEIIDRFKTGRATSAGYAYQAMMKIVIALSKDFAGHIMKM